MRRLFKVLALLLLCFVNTPFVNGQQERGDKSSEYDLQDLSTIYDSNQRENLAKYNDSFLTYLQFNKIPTKEIKARLDAVGVRLHSYHSNNIYLASIPHQLSFAQAEELGIVAYGDKNPQQKLAAPLLEKNYPAHCVKDNRVELAFNFHEGLGRSVFTEILVSHGVEILKDQNQSGFTITGLVDPQKIDAISEEPVVTFIDAVTPPVELLNHEVRSLQQVNYVNAASGKNLNGDGVVVGIGDGGELGDHLDFEGRIINYANGTYSSFGDHGDHVAGIIGGAGTLNPQHRGMASEATLLIQKTSLITFYMEDYVNNHDMVLTNNSYGTSFNCDLNGTYNYTSQTLDIQMRDFPEVLHVFAAGNSGNQTCTPFPAGYNTLLRYYQSAKNVLTVGNVTENREIKANSSRGPVKDGRLKPEICGVGTGVYSTGRTFNYKSKSGTSMSAPAVTGTIALMTESYRDENSGANPKGGLLKAIACNTADDLGNPGPDYIYGYGLINARRSVETIEEDRFLESSISDGGSNTHTVTVPANTKEVKVMLYWQDKEAEPYPVKALVNDLDLLMTTPGGSNYLPWVLDPDPANVANNATRQVDDLNNIEQVTLDNPAAGNYTITVSGTDIPFGPQEYFLVYEFVTDDVVVTCPLGNEVFTPGTNEYIQWDVDAGNTSTFMIEYSTDGGSNWNVLSNSVDADKRFYVWSVPATISENAFVRVTKNNGSGNDSNASAFSILDQPIVLTEPVCYGNVQLNWNAISSANHYEILMFDGTAMTYVDTTSSLEYLLEDAALEIGVQYWFSVVPVTNSGGKGKRAIAQPCTPQLNILCPWPDDVLVEAVYLNERGRAGTKNALGQQEEVIAFLKNTGNNTISNIDIFYSVNGGTPVMETYNDSLASGDSLSYVFSQKVDMATVGTYDVDVWVNLANDVHNNNDSLLNIYQSQQLGNELVELHTGSVNINFATGTAYNYTENRIGLDELTNWDFETVIDGTLNVGGLANSLELLIDDSATSIDPLYSNKAILTTNLESHSPDYGLALDMVYSNNNLFPLEEGSELVNKLFVRGSDTESWLELYSMDESGTGWNSVTGINIMSVLDAGSQSLSSSFQLMFEENGKGLLIDSLTLYQTSSLPVELTKFTAERIGSNALLSWTTASEDGNRYFEVQVAESTSAMANNNFVSLGKVEGQGTTAELNDYVFEDRTPGKMGYRYYRLKQVDFDGKFSYSDIRILKFFMIEEPVAIYPNPTTDYVTVDFKDLNAGHINIKIVNAAGKIIQNFDYENAAGVDRLRIDILNKPSGTYFLKLTQDGSITTYPIQKVK